MSNDAKRYYAVLGVDPLASDQAIRIAFRQRAKELHPDAQSGDASAFILLKRAYDTLCDPDDRAAYDRLGPTPFRPAPPRPAPLHPAPPSQSAYRARPLRTPPLTTRPKPPLRSGVSIGRYVIAFIVMAAISLGGVQAMISLTEAPPSIQTRATPTTATPAEAGATVTPAATMPPGSTKSGFWDADPPPTRPK